MPWEGYGHDGRKHMHQLPRGEKDCRRGCNHDNFKMGKRVKCTVPGCDVTLGRVCGGCGGVY
jgi:hypothetical protein